MQSYNFAGITTELRFKKNLMGVFSAQFAEFQSDVKGKADLIIHIALKDRISHPKGTPIISEQVKWVGGPDGGYFIYSLIPASQDILILAQTNHDFSEISLEVPGSVENLAELQYSALISGNIFFMLGLLFRCRVLAFDGFVLHASSIDYKGRGITFSAPSGTGKSTHTNLWTAYYPDSVRVINDDTPAIRLIHDKPYLFGTPWCGSSFKGINASVPLRYMVVLERGEKNALRRLSAGEILEKLLPRVMLPYYDQAVMEKAMGTFERVIAKVPVFLLKCTPEREAMEIVRSCILSSK